MPCILQGAPLRIPLKFFTFCTGYPLGCHWNSYILQGVPIKGNMAMRDVRFVMPRGVRACRGRRPDSKGHGGIFECTCFLKAGGQTKILLICCGSMAKIKHALSQHARAWQHASLHAAPEQGGMYTSCFAGPWEHVECCSLLPSYMGACKVIHTSCSAGKHKREKTSPCYSEMLQQQKNTGAMCHSNPHPQNAQSIYILLPIGVGKGGGGKEREREKRERERERERGREGKIERERGKEGER